MEGFPDFAFSFNELLVPKDVIGCWFTYREGFNGQFKKNYDVMLPLKTTPYIDRETEELVEGDCYSVKVFWKKVPYISVTLDEGTNLEDAFDMAAAQAKFPDLKAKKVNSTVWYISTGDPETGFGENLDEVNYALTEEDGKALAELCGEHVAKFTYTRTTDFNEIPFSKYPKFSADTADSAAEYFRARGHEVTFGSYDGETKYIVPEDDISAVEFYTIITDMCRDGIVPYMQWYESAMARIYKVELIGEIAGDANCDGELSIADATAVVQSIGNPDKYRLSPQGRFNADLDSTSGITANDALTIQRKILG